MFLLCDPDGLESILHDAVALRLSIMYRRFAVRQKRYYSVEIDPRNEIIKYHEVENTLSTITQEDGPEKGRWPEDLLRAGSIA